MSTSAIIMMALSMLFIWGGLVFAIVFLLKHPEGSVELRDDHGRVIDSPS